MENPARGDSYEEAKKKAKESYKKIGRIWCSALNNYIIFNSIGFRHLMQKRGIFRTKEEQKKRFGLLLSARTILESTETNVEYERRIIERSRVDYWIFTAEENGRIIKLIARRCGSGKIYFLSIYEKIPL